MPFYFNKYCSLQRSSDAFIKPDELFSRNFVSGPATLALFAALSTNLLKPVLTIAQAIAMYTQVEL